MEATFGPQTTVLATYAMSECIPICSNPLSTDASGRHHLEGGVGPGMGAEIGLLDEATGAMLELNEAYEFGMEGEVVVRGPQLMAGYENNPEANEQAFVAHGWMRTGDRGRFGSDGHLYLVGRNKEIINRAGENISPFEVEECFLNHPYISQVLCFSAPHAQTGEAVALLVVPSSSASEADLTVSKLRDYARSNGRLNPVKWPELVLIQDSIPTTASGKPKRIGLATKLGITAHTAGRGGASVSVAEGIAGLKVCLEALLMLGAGTVGDDDDLFDLGLNSILVTQLVDSYPTPTLLILYSYSTPTLLILYSYSTPTLGRDARCAFLRRLLQAHSGSYRGIPSFEQGQQLCRSAAA
jgi:hypothetical protein